MRARGARPAARGRAARARARARQAFDARESQATMDNFLYSQRFAKFKSKRLQLAVAGITGRANPELNLAAVDGAPSKKRRGASAGAGDAGAAEGEAGADEAGAAGGGARGGRRPRPAAAAAASTAAGVAAGAAAGRRRAGWLRRGRGRWCWSLILSEACPNGQRTRWSGVRPQLGAKSAWSRGYIEGRALVWQVLHA